MFSFILGGWDRGRDLGFRVYVLEILEFYCISKWRVVV